MIRRFARLLVFQWDGLYLLHDMLKIDADSKYSVAGTVKLSTGGRRFTFLKRLSLAMRLRSSLQSMCTTFPTLPS